MSNFAENIYGTSAIMKWNTECSLYVPWLTVFMHVSPINRMGESTAPCFTPLLILEISDRHVFQRTWIR